MTVVFVRMALVHYLLLLQPMYVPLVKDVTPYLWCKSGCFSQRSVLGYLRCSVCSCLDCGKLAASETECFKEWPFCGW
jgi:hypothetical protein